MKKANTFIIKLLILMAGVVIADKSIGALLRHFYYRCRHGQQAKITYAIDSASTPILVLGNSRALRDYVSPIITDSLGFDCYNTGRDKQGIYYSLAVLRSTLRRYHPKMVILDLSPIGLTAGQAALDELSILLPYYHQHPELRSIIEKRSPYEKIKTLSSLYCYNSLAVQIAFNNLSHTDNTISFGGYEPLFPAMRNTPFPPFSARQIADPPDTALTGALEQMIHLTRQINCSLIVVVSPVYFPIPGVPTTITTARTICDSLQVPFLDYTACTAFIGNTPLFFDQQHLNDSGAKEFTRRFCHDWLTGEFHKKKE